MYAACQAKGGFDQQVSTTGGKAVGETKEKKDEEKLNLEAPDFLNLGEEEERKSDDDETRRFTIKDFKEKAERFAKENFDRYAVKKKGKKEGQR